MASAERLRQLMRNKELANLGDAFVNFIYSLALTQTEGRPKATKVSDEILAQAFKNAGLRPLLGSRVSKEDLANASEALLVEAYRQGILQVNEGVRIMVDNRAGLKEGLAELLKMAASRLRET